MLRGARTIGTVLAVLSMLAGCATGPTVLRKAGVSESQQKADEAACTKTSLGSTQDPRPSPMPPVDQEAFERCMRAKGYTPVPK
jgi:hypothetical protein